jgi:hypothetical protein
MRARRSRFTRICHRLTRRLPNRRAQWQEIGQLRPHGSMGHPTVALTMQAQESRPRGYDHYAEPIEAPLNMDTLEILPELDPMNTASRPDRGGAAIAVLTAALFLLACAYAAFSGYMHSYDDGFAYLGILGAVGSLLAAGVGICLAASGMRRRLSSRFLSVCALSLAGMYGVLLFFAVGGK